jgi:hypothetical protein
MNHEPDLKLEFTKLLLTFSYIQLFPLTPENYPPTLVLPPFHRSMVFVSEPPASEMIERWVDERGLDFRREDGLQPPPPYPRTILLQ